MKLLLVIPPQIIKSPLGVDAKPSVSIPLGVLYIAAYLRQAEWRGDMEVYDARLSTKVTEYEDGTTIFGDSWEEVGERIAAFAPDVVGISNMFSWQISAAVELSKVSKSVRPEAVTVLGGPHASTFPVEMVKEPTVDYVVMGEGEERLHQMLLALEAGEEISIQGVLHSEEDAGLLRPNKRVPIKFIDSLDDIPIPAYDLVDVERYFTLQSGGYAPRPREDGKRAVTILTSRGCPHQCIFCSVQSTMGYKFRHHSPEYIRRHLDYLKTHYQIDYIHFEDDNFTYDIPRYEEIIDILLEESPVIRWDTPNGVRADSWNVERIKRTKASGCQYLCIAIESSVQRVIDEVVKKKLDLSKVEPVMQACKEVGLPLLAFYVIGLPGETAEEIKSNVDYAIDKYRRYGVYPTFSLANPLPGTEFYDIVVADNLFHGVTANDPPRPNSIKTDEFDPEFIRAVFADANRRKRWITLWEMLTSPSAFLRYLKMSLANPWNFVMAVRGLVN